LPGRAAQQALGELHPLLRFLELVAEDRYLILQPSDLLVGLGVVATARDAARQGLAQARSPEHDDTHDRKPQKRNHQAQRGDDASDDVGIHALPDVTDRRQVSPWNARSGPVLRLRHGCPATWVGLSGLLLAIVACAQPGAPAVPPAGGRTITFEQL